ncbi:MAG: hypothetical protein JWM21_2561 [Acidobacteria bacterium]|nr:hypothetical protein [Acidobacteriota bacterium]
MLPITFVSKNGILQISLSTIQSLQVEDRLISNVNGEDDAEA